MPASWTAPIYDRTALDVDTGTAKGFFNIGDINRIEENLEYLYDAITALGYSVSVTADYTWLVTEVFDEADGTRVIGNINNLRSNYHNPTFAPNTPDDFTYMTYLKANDIEEILYWIKYMIENKTLGNGFNRAGVLIAGTGGLI